MANTSATGGFLVPANSPEPLQGQSFEDFVQEVFVGISGISAKMVRPRFQPEGVNLPPANTNWMAFGATTYAPDTFAYVDERPESLESTGVDIQRNETVTFLCSFYGPDCAKYMAQLRDGLQVPQNRETLVAAKMTLVEASNGQRVPSLVKEKWLDKIDLNIVIRRLILRNYPILSLLSAQILLDNEIEVITINITEN